MKHYLQGFSQSFIAAAFVLLLAAGCSTELDRTNKFDKNAPAENQARATLRGLVTLEGESSFAGVDVVLDGPSLKSIATQADGGFAVNELIPGEYTISLAGTT